MDRAFEQKTKDLRWSLSWLEVELINARDELDEMRASGAETAQTNGAAAQLNQAALHLAAAKALLGQ